ncbi:MAG: GH3 auxin-responsive promoter family protein, partial [Legionella sp.]|nr:GH3 auxin-responsive promoter family protein [Legionella sp.]
QLKDVVQCIGFLNKSPRLVFCYKAQQLKLEYCAISGQELEQVIHESGFNMEPHWYFARNSIGNRVVLVTDESAHISDSLLMQMHEILCKINQVYDFSCDTKETLPMTSLQLPLSVLLAEHHAQSKPSLISQQILTAVT